MPTKEGGSGIQLPDESELGLVSEISGNVAGGPPTVNKFRPPAGFMNETLADDTTSNMEPQDMLNRLRSRAGKWYDLAKLVPALNSKGYDSSAIDEATGINPAEQNIWVVSATVYESLKAEGMPASFLANFDAGGENLLHPFRFLGAERRVAAAQYIIENRLDPPMCEILARSMKEYERRPMDRHGFSELPGDCLSFKYLRDAGECRRRQEMQDKLQQALETAVTDEARERVLAALNEGKAPAESSGVMPTLITLRLSVDELGTRPVVVLGDLPTLDSATVEAAPRTSQYGAFGAFTVQPCTRAWDWVSLPQWRALSMARHPVAITIPDCSAVPAIVIGSKAKTDEDRKRLQGPGILVADTDRASFPEVLEDCWYLAVADGSRSVQVVDGHRAAALQERGHLVGQVLFLARPPVKEVPNKGTDLLQL